jgi:hypothetical protein
VTDDEEVAALAAALTGMFRTLESRPVPEHIRLVVDQLDAAAVEAVTPSPSRSSFPEP